MQSNRRCLSLKQKQEPRRALPLQQRAAVVEVEVGAEAEVEAEGVAEGVRLPPRPLQLTPLRLCLWQPRARQLTTRLPTWTTLVTTLPCLRGASAEVAPEEVAVAEAGAGALLAPVAPAPEQAEGEAEAEARLLRAPALQSTRCRPWLASPCTAALLTCLASPVISRTQVLLLTARTKGRRGRMTCFHH
jgi:hypothetical protein